jgi:hypothetical protein
MLLNIKGEKVPIGLIIKDLVDFRNKLTALRVGCEFIPDLSVELC